MPRLWWSAVLGLLCCIELYSPARGAPRQTNITRTQLPAAESLESRPWSRLLDATTMPAGHPTCAGRSDIKINFVHIPKCGGMSVVCTYNSMASVKSLYRTYGASQGCEQGQPTPRGVETFAVGATHDTYADFAKEMKCPKLICKKGRRVDQASVPKNQCRPLLTFVAHPLNRFLSAFFQQFGKGGRTPRAQQCGFLNCRTGSVLANRYFGGRITPDEYARWESRADVVKGFNEATKMLGLDTVTNGRHGGSRMKDTILEANTTLGRRALAKAKARLDEMDAIGITHDFERAMRVTSWEMGIPLIKVCSCNMNPMKNFTVGGVHYNEPYLSAEAKERILQDNALDVELFQHADMLYRASVDRYERAVQSRSPEKFVCNTRSTRCRFPATNPNSKWISLESYKVRAAASIDHGIHSDCSYSCYRNKSDLASHHSHR